MKCRGQVNTNQWEVVRASGVGRPFPLGCSGGRRGGLKIYNVCSRAGCLSIDFSTYRDVGGGGNTNSSCYLVLVGNTNSNYY